MFRGFTGGATLQQGDSLDRQLSGAEGTERGELSENSAVMLLVNGQAVDLLCLAGLGEQLPHRGELFVVERDPGALLKERGNETWIGDAEFGGFVQEEIAVQITFAQMKLWRNFGTHRRKYRTRDAPIVAIGRAADLRAEASQVW